ncbi:hypothetical protein FZEAL_4083 [Fusarium zealandicum]|uniref:SnoaL-like domain-containing protein n=1 Tax=Fusarium zealandicum TaxID=1053134 RepID=A0A8H4UMD2_9HYPO|nr:hypothetical protein FZEAL_4083 [Fusarium zealandicum]
MSEYTSTREGFQKSMQWSLSGAPEDAVLYAEATATPTFYHIFNTHRTEYDEYVKGIVEWRGKTSDYKPKVEEFLRDGDQLAARMTGSVKVGGVSMSFECFYFAKVNKDNGKLEYLIERGVWGEAGKEPEHGI